VGAGAPPSAAVQPYAPPAQAEPETALPVPSPAKPPAKRKEKSPARKKKEKENLPARPSKKDVKAAQLRPHKLKFNDRDPAMELAISEIAGHLTFTQSTVTAWYSLPEVRWAFRPDAEREALLSRSPSSTRASPASACTCGAPTGRSRPTSGPARSTPSPPSPCPTCAARPPGPTTSSPRSATCSRSTTPRGRPTSA
jgi:hypothetical protein